VSKERSSQRQGCRQPPNGNGKPAADGKESKIYPEFFKKSRKKRIIRWRKNAKETIMARMTDEEAEALDKYYTDNTIMPVKGKPGLFAERKTQMFAVDALSAQYFMAKAAAEHKTTMEIISEMVRERIAASA
jgi:hypothetical protein